MDPHNPYQDIHQTGVPAPLPPEPVAAEASRAPVYVILGTIMVLLAVLVVLVGALLFTRKAPVIVAGTPVATGDTRTVAGRAALSNPNLELVVYAPKQTATNTTINFSIKNTCASCTDSTYASAYDLLGYSRSSTSAVYLVDQDAGQKYDPITDEAKKILGSESCTDYLKSGQSVDCFVSFTKVASGSTVSAVLGTRAPKIDGIKVD
jgi:hypothetical protein